MKKRFFILFVACLVLVPGYVTAATFDQPRLDAIKQRCTVIQTILDQLQRRDLVARTNRGRTYEAQVKQMSALSQRLRYNNVPAGTIDATVSQFNAAVESFRVAYVVYDDTMSTLRQTDCRNNIQIFAQKLEEVKVLRHAVGVEVTKGEEVLSHYRQALLELRATLPEGRND